MTEQQIEGCELDPSRMERRFATTIRGTVASIPPVVEQIMEVVAEMGCAAGKEHEIEVAVNEALANAVTHGCGDDPTKEVAIVVGCDPERGIAIVVRDPGAGFDPDRVPSPVEGERLYADHGRGIYLINQLMDEVRYRRGGSEIFMRKR